MRIPCYTRWPEPTRENKEKNTHETGYGHHAGRTYDTDPRAQKGYGGLIGFLRYIKRRPRRLEQGTKTCCYCGEAANDRPAIAMAVNSSGRLVDMKRLSAPHCRNCGTMVA